VYNNYSDIKDISNFRKNNLPLHHPMWKKEATSYYFCFVKLPWPKDHGQKLLSGSTIANEGIAGAS